MGPPTVYSMSGNNHALDISHMAPTAYRDKPRAGKTIQWGTTVPADEQGGEKQVLEQLRRPEPAGRLEFQQNVSQPLQPVQGNLSKQDYTAQLIHCILWVYI